MTTPPRSELGGRGSSEMRGGVDGAHPSWVSHSPVAKSHLNWCELFRRTEKGAHVAGTGAPLCFQIAITCTQIWWATEVGLAFARLEEGYENAIKDYNKKQVCPAHPVSVLSTLLCEVLARAPAISLSQKQPNIGNSCSAQE